MWMTEYISEVKRQFRDVYNFIPSGGTEKEPLFDTIPNGEYPMQIEGKTDYVKVINGTINCCNFRDIRYYKGKRYLLLEVEGDLSRIQLESNPNETRMVESKYLLTEEGFKETIESRRSEHVNWINNGR